MKIKVEGVDQIILHVEKLADAEKIKSAMLESCKAVEKSAKRKARKKSGELKRSITYDVKVEKGNLTGIIYTPLDYAPYVCYGSGRYAEKGGRKDVPWVYVKGKSRGKGSGKTYTLESARRAVFYLRKKKHLKAFYTFGSHPYPFMRPALKAKKKYIMKQFGEAMKND